MKEENYVDTACRALYDLESASALDTLIRYFCSRKTRRRKVRIVDSDEEEGDDKHSDLEELSPLVSDSGSELEELEKPKPKRRRKAKAKIEGSDSEENNDTEKVTIDCFSSIARIRV